jgi:hypothetical protein
LEYFAFGHSKMPVSILFSQCRIYWFISEGSIQNSEQTELPCLICDFPECPIYV